MPKVTHFFTKIAGVQHEGEDGSNRQAMLATCSILEPLELDRQENNQFDPNAIAVLRQNGDQLGYLRAELAKDIAWRVQQGYRYAVFIVDITGGTRSKPTLGANLLVIEAEPQASTQEAQAYADILFQDESVVGRTTPKVRTAKGRRKEAKGCLAVYLSVFLLSLGIAIVCH